MKRLTERQKRSFKTYGIILIIVGFLLMYMAYSNYRSYSLPVTTGDKVQTVTVKYKEINANSTQGISYDIKPTEGSEVYQIYDSFGKEFFEYDAFKDGVTEGDEITIYVLYKNGNNHVVSGIEKGETVYLDRAKVEDSYMASMKSLGKRIIIFIVISVVAVAGGAVLFVLRAIDDKKAKQDVIDEANKYIDSPTKSLPGTRSRADVILSNPKIKVLSQDDFGPKFEDGKYLDYVKCVNRLNEEYESGYDIRNISSLSNEEIVDIINLAFGKQKVSAADLTGFKSRFSYNKDYWIGLYEDEKLVGVLVGDLDTSIGEASIEYLAVIPEYQRKGYGKALVKNLLNLAKEKAKIVTVFTRADNPNHVIELFNACGFGEEYHWYVLNKQEYERLNK